VARDPENADYQERIRSSFAKQGLMNTLGGNSRGFGAWIFSNKSSTLFRQCFLVANFIRQVL
jgi:hypothetical protein